MFVSQTDTEVIVHLFEYYFNKTNDAKKSFLDTIARLEGAYSLLLITKSPPNTIFFMKHGSPLAIARGNNKDEILFASSDAPLIGLSSDVAYLEDGVSGYAVDGNIVFNQEVKCTTLPTSKQFAQKDGFRFFMEKDIYEPRDVVPDSTLGRIKDDGIYFEEFTEDICKGISEIKLCAWGTSYHAGLNTSLTFLKRISKKVKM